MPSTPIRAVTLKRLAKQTNRKTGHTPCLRGGGGAGMLRPAAGNIKGRNHLGEQADSFFFFLRLIYLFLLEASPGVSDS